MCGVFGFSGHGKLNVRFLQQIAIQTERRGPHAFGFAWVDHRGRLRMFKASGPISQFVESLEYCAGARAVIGHCRYATHGDAGNNLNNHPHPADAGWIVHNGIVSQHEDIRREADLLPAVSECDSEILGALIESSAGGLLERVALSVASTQSPLVMLGLWRSPERLVVVRRGNPLHVGMTAAGAYFASEALPRIASHLLPDNRVESWRQGRVVSRRSLRVDVGWAPGIYGW